MSCRLDGVDTPCNEAIPLVNAHAAYVERLRHPEFVGNFLITGSYTDVDGNGFHMHIRSVGPQNSGPVRLGGTNELKKLIEQTSSSCREAVKKLLTEIAAETKSELTSTDPMELFNQITSQKGGGGLYADITHNNMRERLPADSLRGYTPIASGSGEAWRFWSYSEKSVQRIAIIYLRYSTYASVHGTTRCLTRMLGLLRGGRNVR